MNRSASLALVLAALGAAPAPAQPPATPPAVGPAEFRVVDARADRRKLTWTEYLATTVQKEIAVEEVANGKPVLVKRVVTVTEMVPVTRSVELKGLKATDGAGKAVDADKLSQRLKEPGPVVLVAGELSAKHRELFKDTTLFIELPAPKSVPLPPAAPPVAAPEAKKG